MRSHQNRSSPATSDMLSVTDFAIDSRKNRTSFVAVKQTENGRVLSWRADNLPTFTFYHVSQKFEELFHRAFHDWTRSG